MGVNQELLNTTFSRVCPVLSVHFSSKFFFHSNVSFSYFPGTSRQLSAESRFQDAADQHQEAAKLHLGNAEDNEYESSEDEDALNDENILDSMLKSFRGSMGKFEDDMI